MSRGIQQRWPGTLLAVYWIALAVATHWPRLPGMDIPGKDKTAHVVAYGLLAILLVNVAARRWRRWSTAGIAAFTLVVPSLFGVVDEVTQPLTGRSCSLSDWIADVAGAAAVAAAWLLTVTVRRARQAAD